MDNTKKVNFKKTITRLLQDLKPFYKILIIIILFSCLGAVFTIVGPKILGNAATLLYEGMMNKINNVGSIDFISVNKILLTMLILYIVSAIFNYLQGIFMANISQKYTSNLRLSVNNKIKKLPLSYFDKKSDGEILSLITNDIDTISNNLNSALTEIITCVVMIVGILVMMLSINVSMTIVTIVILPISIIVSGIFVRSSEKHFKSQQDRLAKVNAKVEEAISGHAVIKVFNRTDKFVEDIKKENFLLSVSTRKSNFFGSIMQPIMNLIGNLGYVIVAILGAINVIKGRITVGNIQSFITYTKNFTNPIADIASILSELQALIAASSRVFEFLDEEEMSEVKDEVNLSKVDGNITFKNVKFGYEENKIIINNFTTEVTSGQKIAIVGPTGSGKTTIVKLLMRFYDVNDGEILLDGVNINNIDRNKLRRNFGMVLQDTWLFNGTIMENIRYGNLSASDIDVINASKMANAHHFIKTLPGGYDMILNEETTNISSGQKQLLTIARAILRDPKILILDEATSNVDTRTEGLIQSAMDELMKGRTSFIIAHRLSTIKNADLILVLKDGDIIEQGTHKELLSKNGFYASLYNSQFSKS